MSKSVGIIGSGGVGKTLGLGFLKQGYNVTIGTRDPAKLKEWKDKAGEKASIGSFADAARCDIVVLATLWTGTKSAIDQAGPDNMKGKVVIDVTNPLDFSAGPPPRFAATVENPGGAQVQAWIPGARVVKAFNTISANIMIQPKLEDGTADLFIAGNDEAAKKEVAAIAEAWGWGSVNDMGDILMSFWLETFAMLWIYFGFKNNHWTHAFKLLRK